MGAHSRVAWWDFERWLAMRARRIAAVALTTVVAGTGIAVHQYHGSQQAGRSAQHQPSEAPAVDPTIPWPAPGGPSASAPVAPDPTVGAGPAAPSGTTTPTFVSPTQPWPGTNP